MGMSVDRREIVRSTYFARARRCTLLPAYRHVPATKPPNFFRRTKLIHDTAFMRVPASVSHAVQVCNTFASHASAVMHNSRQLVRARLLLTLSRRAK